MRTLDRKLVRELLRLRGQLLSIALVVAAGIMSAVTMRSTFVSLDRARIAYFDEYRLADVFAALNRAPDPVAAELAALPGVRQLQTRVKFDVTLIVPGLEQPARAVFVSVPDAQPPAINRLHIATGRYVAPESDDELLLSVGFAGKHGLDPGDTLGAVINGRYQTLRITGLALSPEYVYEIEGGGFATDEELFGIGWMSESALKAMTNLDGAFNDVALLLEPGASEDEVIAAVNQVLEPYGGLDAYAQKDQPSAQIVHDEIQQNQTTADILPVVFLSVAAFLLHIVLRRLVSTQRVYIATLKAFGYSDSAIALHYLLYALLAVGGGTVLGFLVGRWLGSRYTGLYADVFRFPELRFVFDWTSFWIAAGISGCAALVGAASAVRSAVRLQPAEGMNPAAPPRFRPLLIERIGLQRLLTPAQRMVLRNLERRPVRAVLAALGVGLGLSVLLVGLNIMASVRALIDRQFRELQREDITVSFHSDRPWRAVSEVARIDGITWVDPLRIVPVRLVHAQHQRRVALTAVSSHSQLRQLVDESGQRHDLPDEGVVLTSRLADVLGVTAGDTLIVQLIDRGGESRMSVVAATIFEPVGLNAYMSFGHLNRLLRSEPRVDAVLATVERERETAVLRALQELPEVAGTRSKASLLRTFDQQVADSIRITVTILTLLAAVLASGIIYNSGRIALSERGHELATLRVLGFSGREVSSMLLGEQAVITAVGLPLGVGAGALITMMVLSAFHSERYYIPFVMTLNDIMASFVAIGLIAAASGWLVRRRLLRADLIAELKTRE